MYTIVYFNKMFECQNYCSFCIYQTHIATKTYYKEFQIFRKYIKIMSTIFSPSLYPPNIKSPLPSISYLYTEFTIILTNFFTLLLSVNSQLYRKFRYIIKYMHNDITKNDKVGTPKLYPPTKAINWKNVFMTLESNKKNQSGNP